MDLAIGSTVIHPRHGAGTVTDVAPTVVGGETVPYIHLRFPEQRLRVRVPAASIDAVGLRLPLSAERLEQIMAVLRTESLAEPANWSRRFKATEEKLRSGSPDLFAEVVRDLHRRQATGSLSPAERKLRDDAVRLLGSEVAVALDVPFADAAELICAEALRI